jgi:trehalose utilization protein
MMKVTVWNEAYHEKNNPCVLEIYPGGIHAVLSGFIKDMPEVEKVRTATLDDEECGLSQAVLDDTDVLIWWGHVRHNKVPDNIVENIYQHVLCGMGLICLHSAHDSKIFKKLMGTSCSLRWKDETYERIFCTMPSHPIAQGIPPHFELGTEETYGEFFDIPQPDGLIFISWFSSGEVFRSGCVWHRGHGKVFYFQPGHETNASLNHPMVRQIIKNGVKWAAPVSRVKQMTCTEIIDTLEEQRARGEI